MKNAPNRKAPGRAHDRCQAAQRSQPLERSSVSAVPRRIEHCPGCSGCMTEEDIIIGAPERRNEDGVLVIQQRVEYTCPHCGRHDWRYDRQVIGTVPPAAPTAVDRTAHLVLSRKIGQSVHIGNDVVVRLDEQRGGTFRLSIFAPLSMTIARGEILAQEAQR